MVVVSSPSPRLPANLPGAAPLSSSRVASPRAQTPLPIFSPLFFSQILYYPFCFSLFICYFIKCFFWLVLGDGISAIFRMGSPPKSEFMVVGPARLYPCLYGAFGV